MKKLFLLLWICSPGILFAQYDIVIVGGTPGGIMTAISSARMGKTSVILERTAYPGGLPANGLGATDIATRGATTGLFSEFISRVKQYYISTYGPDSQQVRDCSDGFHFEPSVAARILTEMIHEHRDHITLLTRHQFDSEPANVTVKDDRITRITVLDREKKSLVPIEGKVFIDATYEGDLAAAAGVPYVIGRESYDEFHEPGAGRIYKYWSGPEAEGTTGQGDNAVQSYNYRLCLTNVPDNRVKIEKPQRYDRREYVSLIEDVWTGRHTGVEMLEVTAEMMEENRKQILNGNPSRIPGDVWGIARLTNMVKLPNGKTDANNQHLAFISTDLPEENWPWPTSGWAWRDAFAERLRDYILGLLWFAQNDKELPAHFRKAASEWGLSKDEYIDNGNFPRQVYVREGRRFKGMYFFTARDAMPVNGTERPLIHANSVTASHYAWDSHAVRKREPGRVHLDGFLSYKNAVYTVPYGVMVSKEIDNLMFPVPVSGSHIGFSTLRMEPCWMALGQAAGVAASLAIDSGDKVRHVNMPALQRTLLEQQATLVYFKDIAIGHPDFGMVQALALDGYLTEWEAGLDKPASESDAIKWKTLSNLDLKFTPAVTTRRELLNQIYESMSRTRDRD